MVMGQRTMLVMYIWSAYYKYKSRVQVSKGLLRESISSTYYSLDQVIF